MTSITNTLEDGESHDPTKPVIFTARGCLLDTRLKVFDTEYHVHSTILKFTSHYFFKFLDSADKTDLKGANGVGLQFKYDWITKVDADGKGWQLVCKGPKAGELNLEMFTQNDVTEAQIFEKLLRTFYKMPFGLLSNDVGDWSMLLRMTELAKFYACLPTLSQSLPNLLLKWLDRDVPYLDIEAGVERSKGALLEMICELRWPGMFREGFIWAMGPSSKPHFQNLANSKVKSLCEKKFVEHCTTIIKVQQELLLNIVDGTRAFERRNTSCATSARDSWHRRHPDLEGGGIHLPVHFNKHLESLDQGHAHISLRESLREILVNRLRFQWEDLKVGAESVIWASDHFLYFEVEDDELPWDTTQTDW